MNFIVISPHFPPNFEPFTHALKAAGVNTLGIGDAPYDDLTQSLQESLTEYYRVDNMEDYDQVYRAVAFFAFKYGRIDRLESQNEYWLLQDAQLRTDFNIQGRKLADMDVIKYKSKMKDIFKANQIPVVDGYRVQTDAEIQAAFVKLGFPLIAKPDNGVGASDTHKIVDKASLDNFITTRHHGTAYFMESFIHGNIVTFDGLTDQDGKVVFYSSMSYSEPALETLEGHHEMYFYEDRKVAPDVRKYGLKAVKAFEIKERFFHIEFFRLADGTLYALEVNCRPAGGSSIDLMNYGHEINLFEAYAQIVTQNHFTQKIKNNYYSTYFSRFNGHEYAHSLEDIQAKYGQYLKEIQHIPDAFSDVMGNIGLIFNTETQETITEISRYVDELK